MAAAPPTREAIKSLFDSMMRTSKSFSSYNFRLYFERRTKEVFDSVKEETDANKLSSFYNDKTKELLVLRRSAIVNQLYGGQELVVERQQAERERGDN